MMRSGNEESGHEMAQAAEPMLWSSEPNRALSFSVVRG
jgi:hypothetical protein